MREVGRPTRDRRRLERDCWHREDGGVAASGGGRKMKAMKALNPWKGLPAVLALTAAAGCLAGCVEIEESLTLRHDLSGTAVFTLTVDNDPWMKQAALVKHLSDGKPGDPTPAEIDATRETLAGIRADAGDSAKNEAMFKQHFKDTIPPGVRLLTMTIEQQGTKTVTRAEFAFDDVRMLPMIGMSQEVTDNWPTPGIREQPFCGLEVIDEGKTVLVTHAEADPLERILQDPRQPGIDSNSSPEVRKQTEAALSSARLVFRIESPMEVVDTNAELRRGRSLSWEVKGSDPIAKRERTLTARFKK